MRPLLLCVDRVVDLAIQQAVATTEILRVPGFFQLHSIQSLRQRMRITALRQLDAQAHLVGAVGVPQCVFVGDLAGVI